MNAKIRKELHSCVDQLEEIKSRLETIQGDETEKLDNMPEGLQESERGEQMQEAIDNLDSSICSIEDAIEYLENC